MVKSYITDVQGKELKSMQEKILVVDDEHEITDLVELYLQNL